MTYRPSLLSSIPPRSILVDDCASSTRPSGATVSNLTYSASTLALNSSSGVSFSYDTPSTAIKGYRTFQCVFAPAETSNTITLTVYKGGTTLCSAVMNANNSITVKNSAGTGVFTTPVYTSNVPIHIYFLLSSMPVVSGSNKLVSFNAFDLSGPQGFPNFDVLSYNYYETVAYATGDSIKATLTGNKAGRLLKMATFHGAFLYSNLF